MTTVTLKSTGREIMNAVKTGKVVMVHAIDDQGYEEYGTPQYIVFSESKDYFEIRTRVLDNWCTFEASLDAEPMATLDNNDTPLL